MKKILTLLIAACAFATLHAQSREEARRVIFGEPKDDGVHDLDVAWGKTNSKRYPVYSNGGYHNRQYEIDQVNREYDSKISSIRNNRYLSNREKSRMIGQLEKDRQNRIREISRQYGNAKRRYDDKDRYERKDNGKHKGWYKKARHNQ